MSWEDIVLDDIVLNDIVLDDIVLDDIVLDDVEKPKIEVYDDPEYVTIYCGFHKTGNGRMTKTTVGCMMYSVAPQAEGEYSAAPQAEGEAVQCRSRSHICFTRF